MLDVAASHEYRRLAFERGGVEGATATPVAPTSDDRMSTTTMVLIGAGVALVLIAAGTTVLLVRRGKPGPAPVVPTRPGAVPYYSQGGVAYQAAEQSRTPGPGPVIPTQRPEPPLPSASQGAKGTTMLDTSWSSCGTCGHPRSAGDRFCPGCGSALG